MLAESWTDYLTPPILLAAGLVVLCWVVLKMRREARRVPQRIVRQETVSTKDIRDMAQELASLLAELQETSRRIAAEIDNRYAKLEFLLQESDSKIKRLEVLSAQIGESILAENPSSPHADSATFPPTSSTPLPPRPDDPVYRKIYELADRGHTAREIAQQVGSQPGEIELILNLRAPTQSQP